MGAVMAAHAKRVEILLEDRDELERLARSRASERRLVERARIVLLAGEGLPASEIAERVGCAERTVKLWRSRYARDGVDGLRDRPKAGRPLTHGPEARARLIGLACTRPPDTAEGVRRARWTHAELAGQVGMSPSQAHVILRAADLRPHLTEQWVMSELGPEFDAQAAEVCGLYLDAPENAIVISLDEKTSIAAREPARPDTLPAAGRPARRDSEYIRNGTTNLFAALRVHSGEVSGMTAPTRNRWDFLAFLQQLEAEIPAERDVVAILDNLSTHKTREVDAWLADHPRWQLVFTPKHASWLNQVEIFFSILTRRLLKHGQFSDSDDLATQMLAYVEHHNLTAQPFAWTYTGKVLAA
jgi:transposase